MSDAHAHLLGHHHTGNEEAQWISLSDLMTGLMMIFMLIALLLIALPHSPSNDIDVAHTSHIDDHALDQVDSSHNIDVSHAVSSSSARTNRNGAAAANARNNASHRAANVAANSNDKQIAPSMPLGASTQPPATASLAIADATRQALYADLTRAFSGELTEWNAQITPDLTIRFNNPEVLFEIGKARLQPRFQQILWDFYPRYVQIITSDKYKNFVQEVRIEGHTSSIWKGAKTKEDAYFRNMELSQARTRSVLRFVLGEPAIQDQADWLRRYTTANGLSSSQLIFNADGTENPGLSQRVEFHIRTTADNSTAASITDAGRQANVKMESDGQPVAAKDAAGISQQTVAPQTAPAPQQDVAPQAAVMQAPATQPAPVAAAPQAVAQPQAAAPQPVVTVQAVAVPQQAAAIQQAPAPQQAAQQAVDAAIAH